MDASEQVRIWLENEPTLLIDLDGTLVDSSISVTQAWQAWGQRCGVQPDDIFAISEGRQGNAVIAELRPDLDAMAEDQWLIQHQLQNIAEVVEIPGARQFLDGLPPQRWAIVTSCPRDLAIARLEAAQLPIPEQLITAEDVTRSKPDPAGFLLGLQRTSSRPTQALVFEDSAAGLAAASAAGIRAVAIHHAARTAPPADQISLSSWLPLLQ